MSTELLRRAAKEMRRRATATTESEPHAAAWYGLDGDETDLQTLRSALDEHFNTSTARADAEHIASWHPAVALAVADLLDEEAYGDENGHWDASHLALAVARAYLGGTA